MSVLAPRDSTEQEITSGATAQGWHKYSYGPAKHELLGTAKGNREEGEQVKGKARIYRT